MTTQATTLVSIIICTRNRAEHLRQTLEAVGRLPVPPALTCEMIVMDNASTDNTTEVAQSCRLPNMPVRALCEPTPGKVYGLNRAWAAARGDILLFLDDDVRPPENWIAGMCAPILSGRADAVAGGVTLAPHLLRPWMEPKHRSYVAGTDYMAGEKEHFVMVGANMALSRAVLAKIPQYDANLGAGTLYVGEETLLSKQIQAAGLRLVAAWDVAVEHHFDADRLRPEDFITFAQREGRFTAYHAHHWQHRVYPLLTLRQVKHETLAALRRLRRPRPQGAVPAAWELEDIALSYFFRQYRRERRRPRLYDRHGLVKREATAQTTLPA